MAIIAPSCRDSARKQRREGVELADALARSDQWITFVSSLELVVCATLALACLVASRQTTSKRLALVWRVWSAGLLFLALDEWFSVRERVSSFFPHAIIVERATAVLYLAVGVGVLLASASEFRRYRPAWPLMMGGCTLFACKVGVGIVDARLGVGPAFITGGVLKLAAEGVMITALFTVLAGLTARAAAPMDAESAVSAQKRNIPPA